MLSKTKIMKPSMIKSKSCLVMILVLFAALLLTACAKKQFIAPKVTPHPTHERLVGKFVWFDLFTHDLTAVDQFYTELFGWSFHDTAPGEKTIKTILRDGVPIANAVTISKKKEDAHGSQWLSYMSVNDVDEASAQVVQNSGSIFRAPRDLPDRGRFAILKDPQGALFAVVTTSDGDPPDQAVMLNHWIGSELWTRDIDGAIRFYRMLAGYEHKKVIVGTDSEYHLMVTENKTRAGIVKILWDDVEPNWVPYIAVENISDTVKKVKQLGGFVLIAPREEVREGTSAIISDPSGAVFAVIQL